jgi:hypothetical protein
MVSGTRTEPLRDVIAPQSIAFASYGQAQSDRHRWFGDGLIKEMSRLGHAYIGDDVLNAKLIINLTSAENPVPYRRKAKSKTTYVVVVVEGTEEIDNYIKAAYPVMVRSLSNLAIYLVTHGDRTEAHFVTMEQGHYTVTLTPGRSDDDFFREVFERLQPLATAHLVIENVYVPDLPESMWEGDDLTRKVTWAGEQLDELNLLPAPWPIEDLLDERDRRHVMHLYGIGGLSYGNLSTRRDDKTFWMSASGVNKARLQDVGRDILLVTGYDEANSRMILSVPPKVKPRRVSVDAIEHYMIYREHPSVGAIIHIHAWIDGVKSTHINYPCGTHELAVAVADLVREAPDPSRAIVGQKNHGLTITGHSLEEIFDRIKGKVDTQVPMS